MLIAMRMGVTKDSIPRILHIGQGNPLRILVVDIFCNSMHIYLCMFNVT